jgi:O-methyltransferase
MSSIPNHTEPAELYLDLLKKCLTRYVFGENYWPLEAFPSRGVKRRLYNAVLPLLESRQLTLVRRAPFVPEKREQGLDWPGTGETLIGLRRLDNLQACIVDVLENRVPGDFIETGVWRGGATIFMRAALKAFGDRERTVWVADSFQGLPRPNGQAYPADRGDDAWQRLELAVSLEEVKRNFERYSVLDDQVQFLVGWFRDTLPVAPIERLAILRLDADLYESTMVALTSLYPKLSRGGYVIVDDFGAVPNCREAVEDFRRDLQISEEVKAIDWTGVYWQRLE